jgi:cytochrome c553
MVFILRLTPSADFPLLQPKIRKRRIALAAFIGIAFFMGSDSSFAADGKALFSACTACHGIRGEGDATLNAPAIAGQHAAYLERQLLNFRQGTRGTHQADAPGAQMRAIATTLVDDATAARLAAYVAGLPGTVSSSATRGDLRNGNNLYQGKCGACHGTAGEGNARLKAPRLTGLDAGYLKRQFKNFRDGVRGTQKHDLPGRQMAMIAKTLPSERDLDDVIAYIQQRGRTR